MYLVSAVLVGWLLFVVPILVFPILLVVARSWRGRFQLFAARLLDGFFLSLLAMLGWVLLGGFAQDKVLLFAMVGGFVLLVSPIPFIVLLRRPSRESAGPVQSHLLHPSEPILFGWDEGEDELVWLLAQFVTRLDPWMPRAERVNTRHTFRRLLDEVRANSDYRGLARIAPRMSVWLRLGRLDPRHCYSYQPEHRQPGEKFGLFVFLHGHGTNYLVVLQALRSLADSMRLILLAPTFGYGNWEAPGGVQAIDQAVRFALERFAVDPSRVFLAGLSQGGAGVSRAAAATSTLYAGLVFISATMERPVLSSDAFSAGWKDRPVLVIQGARDHNVSPRSVAAAVQAMEASGVRVTQHTEPDSGHFLFFAKRESVERQIATWLAKVQIASGGE
jgi:predicted esterase